MKQYVGLDVSQRETLVCVVNEVGQVIFADFLALLALQPYIARKIAVIPHCVWVDGMLFEWGQPKAA